MAEQRKQKEKAGHIEATPGITYADCYAPYLSRRTGAEADLFMGGREQELLNGQWHYCIDQYNSCVRQGWFRDIREDAAGNPLPLDYAFDEWPVMTLPCCWNLQEPELKLYESSMVFTRTFRWKSGAENRVFLRIGAANYLCFVFLNGQYIGFHEGGSTPFFLDVTEALRQGENRIILAVDAARRASQVPMDNTDWFNYGGVFRDISLIRLPEAYVKDFRISLRPDGNFDTICASVRAADVSADAHGDGEGSLTARIRIPELEIDAKFPLTHGKGSICIPACPELWSPENPKRYDVTLTLEKEEGADGQDVLTRAEGKALPDMPTGPDALEATEGRIVLDAVTDRVGFREFRVRDRQFYLNGKRIYLRGICCHEDSDDNGRALTEEQRRLTIRTAKELGCNYMRLAHYPHHEQMAELADEMGMMLWEEIPVYWAIDFENPATYENAANQLTELIQRDYNRASVIIWSVGNENPDTDARFSFMSRLADLARSLDSTRQISAACLVSADNTISDRLAAHLDIIGLNEYCGWYTPDYSFLTALFSGSHPDKPVIVSEYGAGAKYGHHGTAEDKFTEEAQAEIYRRQLAVLGATDYVQGMSPWILFDFRCPRRANALQNYYNRKGLVDSDKIHRKQAFSVLQAFYQTHWRGEEED